MNAVIVVVDSNESTATRSVELLQHEGYNASTYRSAEKLRQFLRTKHVDAIVIQSNVPEDTERRVVAWQEEYCSNARLIRTSEDPQHLAAHLERELGGY